MLSNRLRLACQECEIPLFVRKEMSAFFCGELCNFAE